MTDRHSILDRLEAPLLDGGLERIDLPERWSHPVPDDHEGAIVSRAYASEAIRWARTTRMDVPEFQGVNVLVFPAVDRPAPILGIDLSDDGEMVANFIVDLWRLENAESEEDWHAVRDAFDALDVEWTPGSTLEGPKGELVSDAGQLARQPDGLCPLDEALSAIVDASEEMVERVEDVSARSDLDTTASQRQCCRMQAAKPGGRELLADLLGVERADDFLEHVFYPAPDAT